MRLALISAVFALAVAGTWSAEIGRDVLLRLTEKDLSDSTEQEDSANVDCNCGMSYVPVCVTKDGQSTLYGNVCVAQCYGESVWTEGECVKAAQLPSNGDHVEHHQGDHVEHHQEGDHVEHHQKGDHVEHHQGDHVEHHKGDHAAQLPASENYPAQLPAQMARRANCVCQSIYLPVCAYKGRMAKTYDNKCSALCVNPDYVIVDGKCEDQEAKREKKGHCICTSDYNPVCAYKNGVSKEFSNKCSAKCEDQSYEIVEGECPTCPCTSDFNPVCSRVDGTKYGNACAAKCSGVYDYRPCHDVV